MKDQITKKLRDAFAPRDLEVLDESHLHAGHQGAPAGGNSHFRVTMTSAQFQGKSRVEMQRMVMGVLRDEFQSGLHALALKLSAD